MPKLIEFKKKTIKEESGITLVSLTVTVLVLLVLAGIPVLLFSGENNIIARAFSAKKNMENLRVDEKVNLAVVNASAQGNKNLTEKNLVNQLNDYIGERGTDYILKWDSHDGWKLTLPKEDLIYQIDFDGEVADLTQLKKNYGAIVEGYNANNKEWQIFYANVKETFLISRSIISFGKIPIVSKSGISYSGIENIENSQYGKKWNEKLLHQNEYFSNTLATAYLCDQENWEQYCEGSANYAVGGPTLELFVASWNDTHSEEYQVENISLGDTGYYVPTPLGRSNILKEEECNGIYKATSYHWLASPSSARNDCMISVEGGTYKRLSTGYAYTNGRSVRPIVSIPTNKIKVDGNRFIVTQ